jgi:hypothetical protein
MLGLAGRAPTHVATTALHRPLAAHAAELVASVPVELGPALRQDPGFCRPEVRGCGPCLFKPPRLIQIQFVSGVAELRDVNGEVRDPFQQTEKHGRDVDLKSHDLGRT